VRQTEHARNFVVASASKISVRRFLILAALAVASVVGDSALAGPPRVSDAAGAPAFAPNCANIPAAGRKAECYGRTISRLVERSRDPASEIAAVAAEIHAAGGFIEAACHGVMHGVGRRFGAHRHVTLETLQRYLPRTNDPGCAAGFAHGIITYLGPQIVRAGPKGAVRICNALPTRQRQYTCVHGLGHAYARVYDDYLQYAIPLCRKLGRRDGPDCAQGAFMDYWMSIGGRDGTKRRPGASASARVVCGRWNGTLAMACWYRYFTERPPAEAVVSADSILRLCRGLAAVQRAGCIAGAALSGASSDPLAQVRLCSRLRGVDVVNCLRSVPVARLTGSSSSQLQLIRRCSSVASDVRLGCYRWLGKALAVISNGRFLRSCGTLRAPFDRRACVRGARRYNEALVTFF
jgi:hypothetical protein